MSLENISSRYLYLFAIFPTRSTCTIWPNYPVTEQMRTAFKVRRRMENLPSCAHVLHKTMNLVFHVVVWPSTVKKCTKIKRTCRAFVFLINPIALSRCRCRHHSSFLNFLIIKYRVTCLIYSVCHHHLIKFSYTRNFLKLALLISMLISIQF